MVEAQLDEVGAVGCITLSTQFFDSACGDRHAQERVAHT
jgi:hypothetical protein